MLEAGSPLQKEALCPTTAISSRASTRASASRADIRDLRQEVKVVRETEVVEDGQFREAEGEGDRPFHREGQEDQVGGGERHFRGESREYGGGKHRFRNGRQRILTTRRASAGEN